MRQRIKFHYNPWVSATEPKTLLVKPQLAEQILTKAETFSALSKRAIQILSKPK